jgi:DNA-binding LacI/PurR family transcriptional regulator
VTVDNPPGRTWTMQEVAAAAGVSATTVSHTISGKRHVNAETAARVRGVIAELEYVPNAQAVRLQSGRSRVIALAVPDIGHWYFGRIARGVEEAADARDYGLVVCSTVNADPRREKRYFNMLKNGAADGLVYTTSRSNSDIDELTRHARNSPLVLADEAIPTLPDLPSVSSTLAEGARAVGEHLANLGHRRAIVIAGYPGLNSTEERIAGFRTHFPNALTLFGDYEQESGARLISDLLANDVQFTCVFAHNDSMALGAIQRLREAGLRVPEDVSVVGFDDLDIASLVTPGLTTVRKDMVEIGRRAAGILLDRLEGIDRHPASVVLPTELIVRGTTAPAKT